MLLVDDILMAPVKALLWVFKEIHKTVEQETAGEHEAITRALSELYMKLETGLITEEQFEAQETKLLDRLDELDLQRQEQAADGADDDDEDNEDEDDEEEDDDDEEVDEEDDDEDDEDNGSRSTHDTKRT